MKHSIKSSFPQAGKTASTVRLGIEKMEENKFTPNFKNSVHQQKKASNPFPLARTKDSLKNAILLDRKATSIRISA